MQSACYEHNRREFFQSIEWTIKGSLIHFRFLGMQLHLELLIMDYKKFERILKSDWGAISEFFYLNIHYFFLFLVWG